MDSKTIRHKFLNFFQANQHQIVPSAPIVVKNDPTLMFTNAGMNQFKDIFLGNQNAAYTRVADTQKCLRVSGKHNDLEEVGADGYHHTMFEMLGNWSFGDYFKEEAIALAWKLLTEVYSIDPNRLFVTVFGGDEKDGLQPDSEAATYWEKWVPKSRILFCSKKDNFWEMGDTGPCGPCSEIHIDLRPAEEFTEASGAALVNKGVSEVMEIWNLVFIQYNRRADGSLHELPAKHIDTGMGFERLCMVLQHKKASYDTDVFRPLIDYTATFCKIPYKGSFDPGERSDMAMRVMADHIRAIAFTIADGTIPANSGPGYVIRRILRRAVRYYYSFLHLREPFLWRLVPILTQQMGDFFPEIKAQNEFIVKVVREEESSFLKTLEGGLKKLDQLQINDGRLKGDIAFELYDTFGFPFDLTRLIAAEKGWDVDEEGFNHELSRQKERSRADAKKTYSDWNVIAEGSSTFVGYDQRHVEGTRLLRWRNLESKGETRYQLVLASTPFYPEGGGQVGDKGILRFGKQEIEVLDTVKENDLILHITEEFPQQPDETVHAMIASERREWITRNHSATHLLHAALRKVLGTHVQQKGSLVHQDYLRFDFSHFQKVNAEEIRAIESMVNQKIRENIAIREDRNLPIEEARKAGAMMLFGEKYGDQVRMITFDPTYSIELCGGCHVRQTGDIGFFKIVAESAVAAGVRRIEAVSANGAENFVTGLQEELQQIRQLLNNPADASQQIRLLQEEQRILQKEINELRSREAMSVKSELINSFQVLNGINFLSKRIPVEDGKLAKNLIYAVGKEIENAVIVFGYVEKDKPNIMVYIDEKLTNTGAFNASVLVRQLAKHIQGGGGGQAFFATAGGKDTSGLDKAIDEARSELINQMKA
ncbi:MAG: alanine--tRNA ligase [Saprospiraceae bacterium]